MAAARRSKRGPKQAAGPKIIDTRNEEVPHQANIIMLLSVCQLLGVQFLPLAWDLGRPGLGSGGTAHVMQSQIARESSFAFKTIDDTNKDSTEEALEVFIREILVLSQPILRDHQNIIDLEGVSWKVDMSDPDEDAVSPVLVFHKANHGNLKQFIDDRPDSLTLAEKLDIWVAIVNAINSLHACHFVHADIKPENILVFHEENVPASHGETQFKIADFGFACYGKDDSTLVSMARTVPWEAPDWHWLKLPLSLAKKCEIYTVGLLCFWVLYYRSAVHMDETIKQLDLMGIFQMHKASGSMGATAREIILNDESLATEGMRRLLSSFIESALHPDHNARRLDLDTLKSILCGLDKENSKLEDEFRIVAHIQPSHYNFSWPDSYPILCLANIAVRKAVSQNFLELASTDGCKCPSCAHDAAFHTAMCYKLGFGTSKDTELALLWLSKSSRSSEDLENEINQIRAKSVFPRLRRGKFGEALQLGVIHLFESAHRLQAQSQLRQSIDEYEEEIKNARDCFGDSHIIPHLLGCCLTSLCKSVGDYDKALELQKLSYARGQGHEESEIYSLSNICQTLLMAGRLADAEKLTQDILNRLGSMDTGRLRSMEYVRSVSFTIAYAYISLSYFRGAEAMLESILRTLERTLGADHIDSIVNRAQLGYVYAKQGKPNEAESLLRQAYTDSARTEGKDSDNTLAIGIHLGSVLGQKDDFKGGEDILRYIAARTATLYGKQHSLTLTCQESLTKLYIQEGLFHEAEKICRPLLANLAEAFGSESEVVYSCKSDLGKILLGMGQYDAAANELDAANDFNVRTLGQNSMQTLECLACRALLYQKMGRHSEACELAESAFCGYCEVSGPASLFTITTCAILASSKHALGFFSEAESLFQLCVDGLKKSVGEFHSDTLASMTNLGASYVAQNRSDLAIPIFQDIIKLQVTKYGQDSHRKIFATKNNLSMALDKLGRLEEALDVEMKTVLAANELLGMEDPEVLTYRYNLSQLFLKANWLPQAEALLTKLLEINTRLKGPEDQDTLSVKASFGVLYWKQRLPDKAEAVLVEVLAKSLNSHGLEAKPTSLCIANLGNIYRLQGREGELYTLMESMITAG